MSKVSGSVRGEDGPRGDARGGPELRRLAAAAAAAADEDGEQERRREVSSGQSEIMKSNGYSWKRIS